jgi:antitoxin (DNA-binding transcriptional repressor) of toxin-antitoxin stability system
MAQADSQNTTNATPIDRRGALGLFGRVLGGSALAGAGALPALSENSDWLQPFRAMARKEAPAIIALQPMFQNAWTVYCQAQTGKEIARTRCDEIWPVPPAELVFANEWQPDYCHSRKDTDPEGHQVSEPPRFVLTADALRSSLQDYGYGPRTKRGKAVRRLIPVAEQHQMAREAALELSGLTAALVTRQLAAEQLTDIAEKILSEDAQTLVGLHIKARALCALAAMDEHTYGGHSQLKAPIVGMLHGVALAENIARVIGLGDATVTVA